MKNLDRLPQIADEMLGGLHAGSDLKMRILNTAVQKGRSKGFLLRPAVAAFCVIALAVGLVAAYPKQAVPDGPQKLHSIAAGQSETPAPMRALLDLPDGSITLSSGVELPEYRSVWSPKNGADFPLIGVSGRFYRLMRNPVAVPEELLGEELAQVDTFTNEPSLLGENGVYSNVVSQGETVYALDDMTNALVAAKVDGVLRAFQRVSYAGYARVGKETLDDTLKVSGKVVGLELSGVGTVSDPAKAAELAELLLSNASYEGAALINSEQALLIQLDSGMTMQLVVKGDTVSALGSWSCPEFFEAFSKTTNP